LPGPAQPMAVSQSRADGRVVPPPTVPTSNCWGACHAGPGTAKALAKMRERLAA
jgi:hypothetical protein